MKQVSIRYLIIKYAVIVLMLVIMLSLLSVLVFRYQSSAEYSAAVVENLDKKAYGISHLVGFYRQVVEHMAQRHTVVDLVQLGDNEEVQRWAQDMRHYLPENIGLALIDGDGIVQGNPLQLRLGQACVADLHVHMSGKQVMSPAVHKRIPAMAHFDIITNIVADDEVAGAVFASFSLNVIKRELEKIVEEGQQITIMSADGQEVAAVNKLDTDYFIQDYRLPVPDTDWVLLARVNESGLNTLLLSLGMVNAVSFLLILGVLYFFARRMIRIFSKDFEMVSLLLDRVNNHQEIEQQVSLSELKETENIIQGIRGIAGEIADYQQRLVSVSNTDELTGLANRRSFYQQIEQYIGLSNRGEDVVVVMLDLDFFKQANDRYGHAVGDLILKHLSRVMQSNIRSTDFCARLGGDEFVLLLVKCNEQQTRTWFEKILQDFKQAQVEDELIPGEKPCCELSAGFTSVQAGDDMNSVLERADKALYEAKSQGRGNIQFVSGR